MGVLGWGVLLPSNFTILLPHAGHRHCSSQPALAPGRIRPCGSSSLSGFVFSQILRGGQHGSLAGAYLCTPPPPLPPPRGSAGKQLSMAPSLMPTPPASSRGTGGCPARCRGARPSRRRGGSIPSASLWGRHNVMILLPIQLLPRGPGFGGSRRMMDRTIRASPLAWQCRSKQQTSRNVHEPLSSQPA